MGEVGVKGVFWFDLVHKFVHKLSKLVLVFIGHNKIIKEKEDLAG